MSDEPRTFSAEAAVTNGPGGKWDSGGLKVGSEAAHAA